MNDRLLIPFFTDNDVDNALGDYLRQSGHPVTRLRERMLEDSADPVVAALCREEKLVLVTHNVRHFKAIAQKVQSKTGSPDTLSRIEMECHQVASLERMTIALPTIEFEWGQLASPKQGFRIAVGDRVVRVFK